jgi:hypothetical protein
VFHKLLDIECMKSLPTSREMPSCERSPHARFNVVIMYEDPGIRKQAKKGLNYVAEEFRSDFEIRHSQIMLFAEREETCV